LPELKDYRRRVFGIIVGLTTVLWVLEQLNPATRASLTGNEILGVILFIVSLIFTLVSSGYAAVITIGAIHQQIDSGNWDQLRITLCSGSIVVEAYTTISQIRAWRWCIIESGLRVAVFVPFVLDIVYAAFFTKMNIYIMFALFLPPAWIVMGMIGFSVIVFVLEPFYRMPLIVALAMAITVRVLNVGIALSALVFIVLLNHLLQIVVLIALPVGYTALNVGAERMGLAFLCLSPVYYPVVIYALYSIYAIVRERALLWVARQIS
jgi:hypothetical protein